MLPAQQKRAFSIIENDRTAMLDILQRPPGISETQLKISAVEDFSVHQVLVLIGTVSFNPEGFHPDRTTSKRVPGR